MVQFIKNSNNEVYNIMKLDRNSPIPAYYQILVDLQNRIAHHEWKIGDIFPPESSLVSYYNVSRVTIRQALNELTVSGLITRKRGLGTFITYIPEKLNHDLSFPSEFKEHLVSSGIELTPHLLEISILDSPEDKIIKNLKLGANDKILFIQRVFFSHDIPYSLNNAWIPEHLAPDLLGKGLLNNSLSTTLAQRYNLKPDISDNWIEALTAPESVTEILDIPAETTILLLSTLQKNSDDIVFEYSDTYWIRERVKFNFTRYHN